MLQMPIMTQRSRYDEMQARRTKSMRVNDMRRNLRQFLIGRPAVERGGTSKRRKPARLVVHESSSIRANPQFLSRAATAPATMPASSSVISTFPPFSAYAPADFHALTPHDLQNLNRSMTWPQSATQMTGHAFVGVDPEEQYLAELATQGRRRRSRRTRHRKRNRGCGITWTDRRIRSRIITCCLSVLLLTIVLSTCELLLGLSLETLV